MGISPNTQSLLSQLPITVQILDHLLVVRQPLIFFLLLPLEISPESLPNVTHCLQSLLYSNSTIWMLLRKQYPRRLRSSSSGDSSQDLEERTNQIAKRIEEEMINVVRSWLSEQQPELLELVNLMKEEKPSDSGEERNTCKAG